MSDFEQALMKMVLDNSYQFEECAENGELERFGIDNELDLSVMFDSLKHYFKQKAKEVQHGQGTAA